MSALAAASVALSGCGESVEDKIKQETKHFEFLFFNDASQAELCSSMKRLRDLNAKAKDKLYYRKWSDNIKRDC